MHEMQVAVALGSNLGDRSDSIDTAVSRIAALPGVRAVHLSRVYETAPVGGPPQPDYLNAAVVFMTTLDAVALFERLRAIEDEMGRTRDLRFGPRTIDIDLLLYGDRTIASDELIVPHPRMTERRFVLEPLADVAPDWLHPQTGRTIAELLADLPDDGVSGATVVLESAHDPGRVDDAGAGRVPRA